MHPSTPLLLTQALNVSQLHTPNIPDLVFSLYLDLINGVNVYPWPPKNTNIITFLSFSISTVDFYFNNTKDFSCNRSLIPDTTETATSIFASYFSVIVLDNTNKYSSAPVCPYLFKNAQISDIKIFSQVDSFLYVQLLKFTNVNDTKSINSGIQFFKT
jgi:hypothetical protein